jgi:hypothetical protein
MAGSALPAAALEACGSGCERMLRVEDDDRARIGLRCLVSSCEPLSLMLYQLLVRSLQAGVASLVFSSVFRRGCGPG